MVLALGLITSTTLLALSHILIAIPGFYFLYRTDYKMLSKSSWMLLALIIVLVLSVLFNQDIALKGYKPISKIKYFIFGFLSVVPFCWYFKNYFNEKKLSYLLYAFCITTTVATLSGMIAQVTGTNPITMRAPDLDRNSGLFGMVMNYAHNMSYFLVIIAGLLIYRDQVKKFINIKFLVLVMLINIIGFYFSYTRGAWLAFVVAMPFFFFKNNKKWFVGIFVSLALVGAMAYFFAGKNVIRAGSDNQRISQWKAAIEAFKERPILGYGYLNFEGHSGEIKKRYNLGELKLVSHAHNNFLEILADSGIIGITFYMAWLIFWTIEAYKRSDLIGNISLVFIVAFVVSGLTQSTISLGINLFFIFAVYAISQVRVDKNLVKG